MEINVSSRPDYIKVLEKYRSNKISFIENEIIGDTGETYESLEFWEATITDYKTKSHDELLEEFLVYHITMYSMEEEKGNRPARFTL